MARLLGIKYVGYNSSSFFIYIHHLILTNGSTVLLDNFLVYDSVFLPGEATLSDYNVRPYVNTISSLRAVLLLRALVEPLVNLNKVSPFSNVENSGSLHHHDLNACKLITKDPLWGIILEE